MKLVLALIGLTLAASQANARARDLGIPFEGKPGPLNAVTDIPGVEVGQKTLMEGQNVRTGVTVIFPRGHGNTSLVVHDTVGGAETPVVAAKRRYKVPRAPLTIEIADEQGHPVSARVAVIGSDGRATAPDSTWMHADDGFDRAKLATEAHYFHCASPCTLDVPAGATDVTVQHVNYLCCILILD